MRAQEMLRFAYITISHNKSIGKGFPQPFCLPVLVQTVFIGADDEEVERGRGSEGSAKKKPLRVQLAAHSPKQNVWFFPSSFSLMLVAPLLWVKLTVRSGANFLFFVKMHWMLKNGVGYIGQAWLQIRSPWCKPAEYKSSCQRDPGESAE